MEIQKIAPGKYGVNYGLTLGIVMIIISMVMYAADMAFKEQQWPTYIYYVLFPVIIIYCISQYKSKTMDYLVFQKQLKLVL